MQASLGVAAALALTAVLAAGCSGGPSGSSTQDMGSMTMTGTGGMVSAIEVTDAGFEHHGETVRTLRSITFHNGGTQVHNISYHDPSGHETDVQDLQPGQSWTVDFPRTGSYHVFCKFHYPANDAMQVMVSVGA